MSDVGPGDVGEPSSDAQGTTRAILTVLAEAEEVEFRFLESVTGLTKGNISSHMAKLEAAGYVTVTKRFKGRVPSTSYSITDAGRAALRAYRAALAQLMRG